MSAWKTMESAPKGRDLRVLGWDGHHVAVTYWADGFNEWRDESDATDDGYGRDSVPMHGAWTPTHWMELPEPPLPGESNARFIAGPATPSKR